MRITNRIWRGIACGGLSLVLAGGVGLPMTASAACNGCSAKTVKATGNRTEIQALREQMLTQAKAEDAALQKLVAELNKAPEAKKPDLEAAILTKLVAEHHQRLGEWESLHARIVAFQQEHMQGAKAAMADSALMHRMTAQTAANAQK
jgi:hypothetical protein